MGDMRDYFDDLKEEKLKNKSGHLKYAEKVLENYCYRKCSDTQFKVGNWNFWPTTGLFIHERTGERGRGIRNFLEKIQEYRR